MAYPKIHDLSINLDDHWGDHMGYIYGFHEERHFELYDLFISKIIVQNTFSI